MSESTLASSSFMPSSALSMRRLPSKSKGLVLSELEKLNAIDLANQAPLAALDIGGFVDRLAECKRDLLCARSRSFINPRSRRLEAPGLGGNMPQVERDQQRRMDAISTVLERI
jgi:hypothetical protein